MVEGMMVELERVGTGGALYRDRKRGGIEKLEKWRDG